MKVVDLRNLKCGAEMTPASRARLLPVLKMMSLVYEAGVRLWRACPTKVTKVDLPVVSIGSIGVGGTGKTPLTITVAEHLSQHGIRPAVVSRGWRRRSGERVLCVSDGEHIHADIYEAGDEPYLIARRVSGVGVIVAKNRYEGIVLASRTLKPEVILLDDGFQYRRIAKSLEIICLDRRTIPPSARLLPLGLLREPFSVIRSEHLVVMMTDAGTDDFLVRKLAETLPCRLICAEQRVTDLVDDNLEPIGRGLTDSRCLLAVSGIANPKGFEIACLQLGFKLAASLRYDDHKWYDENDARTITDIMKAMGCDMIVTTEKDILKLPESLRGKAVALRKQVSIDDPNFWRAIREAIQRNAC